MTSSDLSAVEQTIIELLRTLNPHERIEIVKDQNGTPDYYIINRSQKMVLSTIKRYYIR